MYYESKKFNSVREKISDEKKVTLITVIRRKRNMFETCEKQHMEMTSSQKKQTKKLLKLAQNGYRLSQFHFLKREVLHNWTGFECASGTVENVKLALYNFLTNMITPPRDNNVKKSFVQRVIGHVNN